jgi:hypothetical protein
MDMIVLKFEKEFFIPNYKHSLSLYLDLSDFFLLRFVLI